MAMIQITSTATMLLNQAVLNLEKKIERNDELNGTKYSF